MARVAFLMDRVMRKAIGLHGRAFVPMLSGFACASPGDSWPPAPWSAGATAC